MSSSMDNVACVDVHGRTYQTPRSELQWRPAAYAVVIHDDCVLLLRQFNDRYELPGGGLDLGEDPKDAVVREVLEETGVTVSSPVALGVESCLFRSTHSDDRAYHSLLMYYCCSYAGGDVSLGGLDEYEKKYVSAVEWVPLTGLADVQIGSTVDFRPYIARARTLNHTK